ncbi:hypothetical protein CB1_000832003 [Camelus ferus]|nr:hypothetical protein CB1_000832003 [Camelus ferus]
MPTQKLANTSQSECCVWSEGLGQRNASPKAWSQTFYNFQKRAETVDRHDAARSPVLVVRRLPRNTSGGEQRRDGSDPCGRRVFWGDVFHNYTSFAEATAGNMVGTTVSPNNFICENRPSAVCGLEPASRCPTSSPGGTPGATGCAVPAFRLPCASRQRVIHMLF